MKWWWRRKRNNHLTELQRRVVERESEALRVARQTPKTESHAEKNRQRIDDNHFAERLRYAMMEMWKETS